MTKLLRKSDFHPYQRRGIMHQVNLARNFLWLFMGAGKAQCNSEPVLTPDGYTPMGDISQGDLVIGVDGGPTRVVGVYPQGLRGAYRVTFNDGSWTRCTEDHLWSVIGPVQKRLGCYDPVVLSTEEIMRRGVGDKHANSRWHIPMTAPVQHSHKNLPIDPYTLGVILGDGHIQHDGVVSVCTDKSILNAIGATCRPHETCKYVGYGHIKGIKNSVRKLGLHGKRSWEKYIPEEYSLGSVDQRYALLQGLFDTDGSIEKGKPRVEYTSTSEQLVDDAMDLATSLGGEARKSGPRVTKHQGGDGRPSWRLYVKLPNRFPPFRLKRKLSNWKPATKYKVARLIASIEFVGYEEATCIRVSASDGLYLTRHHIVTHNTPMTLTTIDHFIVNRVHRSALVLAPLRVVQSVWEQEARKWAHTKDMRFSMLHGPTDRLISLLHQPAEVYLINYEGLHRLLQVLHTYFISPGRPLPFDMLVVDECSKVKNPETLRVESLLPLLPHFPYRTGLTGSPAPNGLLDLFGQFYVIDDGLRFGPDRTAFRSAYFKGGGHGGYTYTPAEGCKEIIYDLVADITLEMAQEDYIKLPDFIVQDVKVDIPPKARKKYDELEILLFTQLETGEDLEVNNPLSKANKLLQMCNGAVYTNTETREWAKFHDAKLDALEDIIEECAGNPILLGYNYRTDAERIKKKFKYAVDLSALTGKQFVQTIADFQEGMIKLLIGHPACVHGSTELLTEHRGWVKITEIRNSEKVYDGVEFVNHKGCSFSGFKETVDIYGLQVTPDHRLLINNRWVEAKDVRNNKDIKREALYEYKGDNEYLGAMCSVRNRVKDSSSKCNEAQSFKKETLPALRGRRLPPSDGHKDTPYMVWHEIQNKRFIRQKLRGSWDRLMQRVGGFFNLLQGYGGILQKQLNNRAGGRKRRVLQGELRMGYATPTAIEQTKQPSYHIPRGNNTPGRLVPRHRGKQRDAGYEAEQRDVGGPSCSGRNKFTLREKRIAPQRSSQRKAAVYDLVDCGPRHRFLIRNGDGEIFISHNSMAHGVDGLQKTCNNIVWYGVPWNLEFFVQLNARVQRQGKQEKPTTCYRILANDSMDEMVADKLGMKADTEKELRQAVSNYYERRMGKKLSTGLLTNVA